MKKRVIGLLLSVTLVFGLIGCGNSSEPEQVTNAGAEQETDSGTEQEETKEYSKEYDEFEYFYVAEIYDSDKVISCNLDNLSISGIYCGDWELTNSIDLYARREGGVTKVGYTKENIPVNVFASDEEWIQLYFEKEKQPNTYIIIKVEDFLANSNYSPEAENNNVVTEEQETENTYDYDKIFEKVGYEKDKTYTIDEYIEVFTKILEELGKKSNVEVASDFREYIQNNKTFDGYRVQQLNYVLDYENHEEMLEMTEAIMDLLRWGADGRGGITEFYMVKGESKGQEAVIIYYKTEAAAREN